MFMAESIPELVRKLSQWPMIYSRSIIQQHCNLSSSLMLMLLLLPSVHAVSTTPVQNTATRRARITIKRKSSLISAIECKGANAKFINESSND